MTVSLPRSTGLPNTFAVTERQVDDAALAAWLDERCGCLTASRMADAMSFKKDGTPTQKRSDYMRDLLAERLTGISTRHYVTPAMQHGLDNEGAALLVYSVVADAKIRPAGFIPHPKIENCGATPDGIVVGYDGLVEAKCPTTGTFVDWVLAGVVPEEYKPQMLLQLACTRRKWVDFFAYDPRIKEEGKRYFLRRYDPSPADITSIELQATRFLNELDELWESFVTK